jgi:hypothetical protein
MPVEILKPFFGAHAYVYIRAISGSLEHLRVNACLKDLISGADIRQEQ